eukprot:403349651
MPIQKEGETIIGFRPKGNVDIFSKPKNFNFDQQRMNTENFRFNLVKTAVALSLIPIFIFVKNAEQNFKNAQVKQIAAKRRERLDQEHGINREEWKETMKEMDKTFRVTEKEEIEKYRQVGKTAEDYYQQREMRDKQDQDRANIYSGIQEQEQDNGLDSAEKPRVISSEKTSDGLQVSRIAGNDYEQIQVQQVGSTPDPRVLGPKIVFDTRLDKFSTPQESKDHIKQKQQELPPYTLDDKKKLLIKMLSKKNEQEKKDNTTVINNQISGITLDQVETAGQTVSDQNTQEKGFKRTSKKTGFKNNDAEAEPIYIPTSDQQAQFQTNEQKLLFDVAEKYNIIVKYLNRYDKSTREFLSFILIKSIPNFQEMGSEEIREFLEYLEDTYVQQLDCQNLGEVLKQNMNEQYLRLKIAKESIDLMINQHFDVKEINVREAFKQGLGSQVDTFKKAVTEMKKLQDLLKTQNEYAQGVKVLASHGQDVQGLQLDQQKVTLFVQQIYVKLRKLEQDLNEGNMKLINTQDRFAAKSREQNQYTRLYSDLQHKLDETLTYTPNLANVSSPFQPKIDEIENFFTDIQKNGEIFKRGQRKLFFNEQQIQISLHYLAQVNKFVSDRQGIQQRILNDIKVIILDMKERLEGMTKFIAQNEDYDKFLIHLRDITSKCVKYDFENNLSQLNNIKDPNQIYEEDFIYDPRILTYMLLKNGTPDQEVLVDEAQKLLQSLTKQKFKAQMVRTLRESFSMPKITKKTIQLYEKNQEHLMQAIEQIHTQKLKEARDNIVNITYNNEQFDQQEISQTVKLIKKIEMRLYAEILAKKQTKKQEKELKKQGFI